MDVTRKLVGEWNRVNEPSPFITCPQLVLSVKKNSNPIKSSVFLALIFGTLTQATITIVVVSISTAILFCSFLRYHFSCYLKSACWLAYLLGWLLLSMSDIVTNCCWILSQKKYWGKCFHCIKIYNCSPADTLNLLGASLDECCASCHRKLLENAFSHTNQ